MTETRCALPCNINDHRRVYHYVWIKVTWPEYWLLSNWRELGYPSRSAMIRHRLPEKVTPSTQTHVVSNNNTFKNRLVSC
jgi:hypothetical protein